jgi:hypothetical protein
MRSYLRVKTQVRSVTGGLSTTFVRLVLLEDDKKVQREREKISLREVNSDCPNLRFLAGSSPDYIVLQTILFEANQGWTALRKGDSGDCP